MAVASIFHKSRLAKSRVSGRADEVIE